MQFVRSVLTVGTVLLAVPGSAFAHGEEVLIYVGGVALFQFVFLALLVFRWYKYPPVVIPIAGYIAGALLAWYIGLDLPADPNPFLVFSGMALLPLIVGCAVRYLAIVVLRRQ